MTPLVDEIVVWGDFLQCLLEEFQLDGEIHALRSVQAYEAGVYGEVGVLAFRSR